MTDKKKAKKTKKTEQVEETTEETEEEQNKKKDNPEAVARRAINLVLNKINKSSKDITKIGFLGKLKTQDVTVTPTGSLALDMALGVGGYPDGRIIEVWGPESCIYRDSWIPFEVWSANGKERINHKGGTIGRLYERFHNTTINGTPKQGRHSQTKKAIKFYVKSVNDEGSIVRNEILDVIKTGEKVCYQIATEHGNSLVATGEHKFLTPNGYKPLEDLTVGDTVFIHNNTRRRGKKHYSYRPDITVKYHPHWPTKVVHCPKTNSSYLYYRGQMSRAVYEAHMNNMTLDQYLEALNTWYRWKIQQLNFLPADIHVHHIDEDFSNNKITNLKLIDPSEHGKLHAKDRHANLSFVAVPSKLVMKEIVGPRETYDLKCAFPYNNYIAQGIVVHNSGKTTLCLHAIAEAQKQGAYAAFIDIEHTLDPTYAENLGVDINKLVWTQPDSGSEAMRILDTLVRSGTCKLIVVDSVAALSTEVELEGDIDKNHMGQQARLMSQALRILTVKCSQSNTTVIFTNQIRMKIGVMYGNPETTPGGNALKFYASQRLDIRRKDIIKEGSDIIGNKVRVKVVKNKVAPPYKEAFFNIIYGTGIDKEADIINVASDHELIERKGAWYFYKGERIGQGIDSVIDYFKENPKYIEIIRKELLQKVSHINENEPEESQEDIKEES